MKRIIILAALAAATVVAVVPTVAQASVRGCYVPLEQYGPHDDRQMNIGTMSVRNTTCSSALRAIDNGWLYYPGWRLGFHTRGYYCYTVSQSRGFGTVLGQQIRCVAGARAFRFSWVT